MLEHLSGKRNIIIREQDYGDENAPAFCDLESHLWYMIATLMHPSQRDKSVP